MRLPDAFGLVSFPMLLLALSAADAQPLPQGNPIPTDVPVADWSIVLEDVVRIPDSSGTFPRMEVMAHAGDGTGRLYLADQRGKVWRFDPEAPDVGATLFEFADLAVDVPNNSFRFDSQLGVRGLAFHPGFADASSPGHGKVYTAHTRAPFNDIFFGEGVDPVIFGAPGRVNNDSLVAEWTVGPDGAIDPSSYREVVLIGQPADDHNIGQISFNPTVQPGDPDYGKLYVALGDGGGPNDPQDLAQDTREPLGSYLRFDPLRNGSDPLSVPSDNPLRVDDDPGIAENLIYLYGVRNAHRFTWDAETGEMFFTDIGQGNVEEVNLARPGANYGWDAREGAFAVFDGARVEPLPADHPSDPFTYPVAQYDHNTGPINGVAAIAGGLVYRGGDVPELEGRFLFGDFSNNHGPIFAVDADELVQRDDFSELLSLDGGRLAPFEEIGVRLVGEARDTTLLEIIRRTNPGTSRTDLRFGQGPDGEIYLLNKHDGTVRRIVGTTLPRLSGDANFDGVVDLADLTILGDHFGRASGASRSEGDFNGDGAIDLVDLTLLGGNFGASAFDPGPSGAIPEPTTWVMLSVGGLAWGCRARVGRGRR